MPTCDKQRHGGCVVRAGTGKCLLQPLGQALHFAEPDAADRRVLIVQRTLEAVQMRHHHCLVAAVQPLEFVAVAARVVAVQDRLLGGDRAAQAGDRLECRQAHGEQPFGRTFERPV
jgi:hypothetical protein